MDATEQARSLIAEGATTEDVLARLRQAGHDQSESRKALRESAGMTVWEARVAVFESETWSDVREETIRLEDAIWATLVEFADEVETDADGSVTATFDLTQLGEREDDS